MTALRILHPQAGTTSVADELAALDLHGRSPTDRPYVITNFVVTVDGRATIGGRSGPIGSDSDTSWLLGLRTVVDAVMIGAGTLRVERYGRMVPSADARARREGRGLAHDPLAVVVSNRLDIPWDAGLFVEGGPVVIFTASADPAPATAVPVAVERHRGSVDLAAALRTLRHERGIRALLCEGGPHLHAGLIAAGLVDELFVTVAPKLAGGVGPPLVEGLAERKRGLELVRVLEADGELFTRYRVRR